MTEARTRAVARLFAAVLVATACAAPAVAQGVPAQSAALAAPLDYDLAAARASGRVPALLHRDLTHLREVDAVAARDEFIRTVLPIAMAVNERINEDRARLLRINGVVSAGRAALLTPADGAWVAALADAYGLGRRRAAPIGHGDHLAIARNDLELGELLRRVDAVPASLLVAEAALRSDWGAAPLARTHNALFATLRDDAGPVARTAEPAWSGHDADLYDRGASAPEFGAAQRAAFASLYDCMLARVMEYNTGSDHAGFRAFRAKLRASEGRVTGSELAHGLSEIVNIDALGVAPALNGIIDRHRLAAFDAARLDWSRAPTR